jgi:hypothetical protein
MWAETLIGNSMPAVMPVRPAPMTATYALSTQNNSNARGADSSDLQVSRLVDMMLFIDLKCGREGIRPRFGRGALRMLAVRTVTLGFHLISLHDYGQMLESADEYLISRGKTPSPT